jgi:hypothetical protein
MAVPKTPIIAPGYWRDTLFARQQVELDVIPQGVTATATMVRCRIADGRFNDFLNSWFLRHSITAVDGSCVWWRKE